MPRRIAVSSLNASTIDILNTIRANASMEYQNSVPEITQATEIPKVGEVLYGYPALANQFLSALMNRIALVRVKSATFNNAYAKFKKGYLEYGETVEEVFVNIAKAREFNSDKAEARELKKTLPDVRSAFHTMNYRVQYPVSITDEEFRMAFVNADGVEDLIAKIVSAITVAAEYDEYLLFKYLLIKAVSHGKMYPVAIGNTMADAAKSFRGMSNQLTFMSTKYNASGVHTVTNKQAQHIFMDSQYNAAYDVDVLASAFNMDKAEFMGKLELIDDFTTFDSDRFSVIMAGSDQIEEVTDGELQLMAGVKAILVDEEWFQVYDNLAKFTEKYVASGLYWNYFYNVWKTVSFSPFSNAVVFVANTSALPNSLNAAIRSKSESDEAVVFTLEVLHNGYNGGNPRFIQTADLTEAGVAVHPYGAIIVPESVEGSIQLKFELGDDTYSATVNPANVEAGGAISFAKESNQ